MDLDILQLHLRHAPQILPQNIDFESKLMLISGVLVVAASAPAEIGTGRRDPRGGRSKDVFDSRAGKTFFLLDERGLDSLPGKYEWHEDGFARAALIGRQAREAVAAIDEFFDGKFQASILSRTSLGMSACRREAIVSRLALEPGAASCRGRRGNSTCRRRRPRQSCGCCGCLREGWHRATPGRRRDRPRPPRICRVSP